MYDPNVKQPKPVKGTADVATFVTNYLLLSRRTGLAADIEARVTLGAFKYGHRLETRNGRDPWVDLLQELEDGLCYAAQAHLEGQPEAFTIFRDLVGLATEVRSIIVP